MIWDKVLLIKHYYTPRKQKNTVNCLVIWAEFGYNWDLLNHKLTHLKIILWYTVPFPKLFDLLNLINFYLRDSNSDLKKRFLKFEKLNSNNLTIYVTNEEVCVLMFRVKMGMRSRDLLKNVRGSSVRLAIHLLKYLHDERNSSTITEILK